MVAEQRIEKEKGALSDASFFLFPYLRKEYCLELSYNPESKPDLVASSMTGRVDELFT